MGISSSVGLVSGLQTDSIVTSLMSLEKAPIAKLQQKQSVYQAKISSYGMLKSSLSSLQTAISGLKSPDSFATGFTASSSNKDILSVSVSDSKIVSAGSYKIKVNQLATSAQMTSNTYASSSSAVGGGVLHFKTGDGSKMAVTIDPAQSSLADIAKAINGSTADVTASVVRVAENDYRLSLTAKSTGKDIGYSFQESGLTFSTSVQAGTTTGETMKSQVFDSADTALGLTGTLSINGTDIALTGTETLNDIQASVDTLGDVSATVDFDSTTGKYSLAVTRDTAGQGLDLSFKDGDDATGLGGLIDPSATVAAKKALVNINNIDVERDSNTITDLVEGLTLNLAAEDTEKTVTVSVTADHNTAKTKMDGFVEAFNNVIKSLNSLQAYDKESGAAGNLLGDSTASTLRSGLRRMIFSSVSGVANEVNSLSRLGIEVEETGLLSLDSSKFTSAMTNNAEEVQKFFTSDETGSKGFAVQFDKFLGGYLATKDGILSAKIDGYTSSSARIDKDIEAINTRLAKREETLRKQYASLEQLLSTFSSTSSYLANQLSVLSNMTSKFNS